MRTRNDSRRARFPALREDRRSEPAGLAPEEEDYFPSSECVAMDTAQELPALIEHLRECGSRTLH